MAAQGRARQRLLQSLEEEQRRRDEVVRHLKAKGSLPGGREATEDHSLEKVLLELEKEKLRCENLAKANSRLREQLNKANEVNSALQEDVGKLKADQMKAQEELELKESEWRSEREALTEMIYAKDHTINMLQHKLRQEQEEGRRLQQRLEQLEEECRSSRQLQRLQTLTDALRSDCAKLRKVKEELQQNLRKEQEAWHLPQHNTELQLKEKVEQQQAQERAHRDHELLLKDFAALEEERSLLQRELLLAREALEKSLLQRDQLMQDKHELTMELEKVALDGSESTVSIASAASTQCSESSFTLSSVSSTEAECAFALCKEQPAKRQEMTQALTEKIYAKDHTINMLQHKLRQEQEEGRRLQQRLEQLEEEYRSSRQLQRLQTLTDALRSDCAKLRKVKEELQQNLRKEQEAWHLPQHNTELQLKEKVDQQQAQERAHHDHELLLKDFAALEEECSLLQRELLLAREALEKSLLQRDQLMQDKHELTMELEKVCHQQDLARIDLEQLRQEFSGQVHALAEVSSEKELLVQKVAALEVQVAALEQDRQGLSEQLTQARAVNKTLEYSLSEAQQHILQLEITRSQLEIQLQRATQAIEVIQGEVRCLKWKLEAERSLTQGKRENMAEQLLQAEQQHNKTLKLQETDRDVERNKLLQAQHEQDRPQAAKAKALQETLTHVITILSEREGETLCQEQTRTLEKQKEMHEPAPNQVISDITDQNLESLQKQNPEAGEATKMLLRTVCEQVEQTLETLREKDRLLAIQRQQTRSYEEKTEEQMNVLRKDLQYAKAVLKEKYFVIESQKEVIETFQSQERDSEQQKKIRQQLEVALKEKDQEIVSLRKQCEAWKEKEKQHGAEQTNLQATKQALREREKKIRALEEAVSKLQQQKEEAAVMAKAMQQKLQYMESSLGAREKEIVSLQGHVQDLQKQKELAGKQARTLEQDLEKMRQRPKENNVELLKQTEESSMLRLYGDLLEKVVEKRDTDRLHHQQAIAEGAQQSWLLEKKLLLQQLESLQQEIARLKLANTELKQFNAELKKTLEEVECQRRKLMRLHRAQLLPGASGSSFSRSHQHKMPASRQEESYACCSHQVSDLQNQGRSQKALTS